MKYRIMALLAVTASAVALAVVPAAASPGRHALRCPKPVVLAHRESLNQWYRQTGINPAITLYLVEKCDSYHGGWTSDIANLLNGRYGSDIFTATLPRGTRLWKVALS